MSQTQHTKNSVAIGTKQLLETMARPSEHEMLENLTLQIVQLITENKVNVRQAIAVLELAKNEIRECQLVHSAS